TRGPAWPDRQAPASPLPALRGRARRAADRGRQPGAPQGRRLTRRPGLDHESRTEVIPAGRDRLSGPRPASTPATAPDPATGPVEKLDRPPSLVTQRDREYRVDPGHTRKGSARSAEMGASRWWSRRPA